MCGIIGYVGKREAAPVLLDGLRRLEYRGYDSAGLAMVDMEGLRVRKHKGRLDQGLGASIAKEPLSGSTGIGHTRWATHGPPSDKNSHPHLSQDQSIALVHNGIIENSEALKNRLIQKGHQFVSDTDSEVLAHLIGEYYSKLQQGQDHAEPECLRDAVVAAMKEVTGTLGIAVVCRDFPDVIIGARKGSPLIIGVGEDEKLLASDANAIVAHTREVVYLNDYDVVILRAGEFDIINIGSKQTAIEIKILEQGEDAAEKGEFAHHMLKEIHEQPETVRNAVRGRIDTEESTGIFGGLNLTTAQLRDVDRIVITACGTSWHAGLVGEYLIEALAHLPTEVEVASEFRYRNAPLDRNTLVIAITQSGETADTLAALREAKRKGHKVLSICNVVGSSIAREADGGIYLHAGPEIGVASTKAFTSQVSVLVLFALMMGRIRMLSARRGDQIIKALEKLPEQIEEILAGAGKIEAIAKKYASVEHFFFLGRLINFPVALEGALKLKEISYIHAEGYSAAEMKHGPLALIQESTPVMGLIPDDLMFEKVLSNLEIVKARNCPLIAITTEGNDRLHAFADDIIYVPETLDITFPILAALPLQLFSYYMALARGCDVDKPRHLAKSVTVE